MKFIAKVILCALLFVIYTPPHLHAAELIQDKVETVRAVVIDVLNQEKRKIPGTDVESIYQTIRARILEGEKTGNIVTVENDYLTLTPHEKFFLHRSVSGIDGGERYSVRDIDRRWVLISFIALFIAVVVFFSGKQGVRSILGLFGSFCIIIYLLIPSLLAGYPAVITSIIIATSILFCAIYFTHGFNRLSTTAFIGTVLAVTLTGILARVGVTLARFSGFSSDEAIYLNFNTGGTLDFTGLLLGGIIIGVLGVLDDIAITQAAVVQELYRSTPHLSQKDIYIKALRIGREHVGALVNTLALAYTGASLPILLYLSSSSLSLSHIINQEMFAVEIMRTIIGSIGLILTVPITTLLAIYMLKGYTKQSSSHHGHHH